MNRHAAIGRPTQPGDRFTRAAGDISSRQSPFTQSLCTALLLILFGTHLSLADDAPRGPVIERIPAGAETPPGDWTAVDRSVFERFLEFVRLPAEAVPPPAAYIHSAKYTGTFDRGVLAGTLELSAVGVEADAARISLGDHDLHLAGLTTGGTTALWGTDSAGLQSLIIPGAGRHRFDARWTVTGTQEFDSWKFDVHWIPAVLSQIELTLPLGMAARSSTFVIDPPRQPGGNRWTIHLGRRTHGKLTIGPLASEARPQSATLRQQISATAHEEGIDLLVDLELAGQLPDPLEVIVPSDLQISSATLNGEHSLSLTSQEETGRRRVHIRFPGRPTGKARVRLRAFEPNLWSGEQPLPTIEVVGVEPIEHQLTLYVRSPLLLRDLSLDGYTLSDRRSEGTESESWVLHGMRPDPVAIVDIARPVPQPEVSMWTLLDCRTVNARLTSLWRIRGQGGPTYSLTAQIPASWNWDILTVAPPRGDASTLVAAFDDSQRINGTRVLRIDLRNPIRGGETLDLVIEGLSDRPGIDESRPSPTPRIINGELELSALAVLTPPDRELALTGSVSQLPVSQESRAAAELLSIERPRSLTWVDVAPRTGPGSFRMQFEPIDPLSSSEAGTSLATASIADEHSAVRSLNLTTHLAVAGSGMHAHEAQFQLRRPVPGPVMFRLDATCPILDVLADGSVCRVERRGEQVTIPLSGPVRESLTIRYRSQTASGRIWQNEKIPIPRWLSDAVPLEWTIDPSLERSCAAIDIPYAEIRRQGRHAPQVRLFGPLSRVWMSSFDRAAREADSTRSQPVGFGILKVTARTTGQPLLATTWDPRTVQAVAWCILSLTVLIVVCLRRMQLPLVSNMAPLWLTLCIGVAWFVPNTFAPWAGAVVMGSFAGVFLPRRLVVAQVPDPDATVLQSPDVPTVITTGLAVLAALIPQFVSAQETSEPPSAVATKAAGPDVLMPLDDEGQPGDLVLLNRTWTARLTAWQSAQPRLPAWLIQQASYDITVDSEVLAEVSLTVVRQASRPAALRLPFDDVVFESSTACEVDGEPTTIIPAASGGGVVIELPAPSTSEEAAFNPTTGHAGWRTHRVRLWFRIPVEHTEANNRIRLAVPPVASSRVTWNFRNERPGTLRIGDRNIETGLRSTPVSLPFGRLTRLDASWGAADAGPDDIQPASSPTSSSLPLTLVDVQPLRAECRSLFLLPQTRTSPGRGVVILPHGSLIDRVRLPAGAISRIRQTDAGVQLEWQAQGIDPDARAEVRYTLPLRESSEGSGQLHLPAPLGFSEPIPQVVGLRTSTALVLDVAPNRTDTPDDASQEFSTLTDNEAIDILQQYDQVEQPERICRIGPRTTLLLELSRRQPRSVARIEESIALKRGLLEWTATIRLRISDAPAMSHVFRVDPRIDVARVSVTQDSAERLARTQRLAQTLELILDKPLSGDQTISISGTMPFEVGEQVAAPQLRYEHGTVESHSTSWNDISGWPVELATESGVLTFPETEEPDEVGLFSGPLQSPQAPLAFRQLQSRDSATASLLTVIASGGETEQVTLVGRVRPVDAPLRQVRIRLPAAFDAPLTLFPQSDRVDVEPMPDGSQLLILAPERFRGGEYRFRVHGRFRRPEASSVFSITPPTVESAMVTSSRLVLDQRMPFRPTSAWSDAISASRLERVERAIAQGIGDGQVYEARGDQWTFAPFDVQGANISVALITSRIWLDREQAAAGETRVTVVTRAASELQLRIPEAVSIRTVRTADGLLPFRREGTATAVLLPGNLRGGPVTIEWQTRNRQSTVPLMTLASGKAPPHLVELVGAAESGWLAVDPLSSETAAIIEMQALLEALESQSSRSFRIDDPLLARLRTLDARINRSEDPRAEQLRATWRRLTGLIAVRTDEPGRVPAAIADPSVDLLQTAVTLPQERAGQPFPLIRLRRRPAVESADIWFGLSLVAAVILLFMLSRRGIPRRIADELAKQPGLACLVIGVPWVVYLSPRPIGILLIAVGLFLLIRSTRLSRRLSGASTR